ncbi:MAG: sulfatase-like hydrolase/transferase [Deltaproteobacteria bacterium]|nr:sulfatase-like hydrolase/transferase [Deltaproteobacteria bacterium]
MTRTRVLLLVTVGLGLAIALPFLAAAGWRAAYKAGKAGAFSGRGTVVMVVLDNVRADHTSLCGYARPTTPNLEALAREGVHTCRAYAPGTWTLPSHASYFTGVPMLDHGAHELPVVDAELASASYARGTGIPIRGLDDKLPTIAEQMASRGYQTAIVSANPVVGKESGLARGFRHGVVSPSFGALMDERVVGAVADTLRDDLDPLGGPLFLFVNLAEAHQPWAAVPEGVGWVPARDTLKFHSSSANNPWYHFPPPEEPSAERDAFLGHLTDVYDYGIWRADRSLGAVLDLLRARGWCGSDCRVVVTSDHGELLGEHGLIDHGFYPWEGNARVPLVATGTREAAIEEPFPGTLVHALALDGTTAGARPGVSQAAFGQAHRARASGGRFYAERMTAAWAGTVKWVWQGALLAKYDLAVDPAETHPLPADDAPPAFTSLRERTRDFSAGQGGDDALREQLEAAGYLEPAPP